MQKLMLSIAILLFILVGTTGSSSTEETRREPSPTTTTPTELNLPEISVSSPPKNLCLETGKLDSSWPLEKAIKEWNKQFKVQLRIDSDDCYAVVPLEVRLITGKWGETRNDYGKWSIAVSPEVPEMWRQHVLCHELGHLVGLGHSSEIDSCMNIQLTHPVPSKQNLEEVGGNLWLFAE